MSTPSPLQPGDARLEAILDEVSEGFDLNGKRTEYLNKLTRAAVLGAAQRKVARGLDLSEVPDFAAHAKTLGELQALGNDARPWLIERLSEQDATTGIIAPTNIGGSTFQAHIAACLLTGEPVLGLFEVAPADYRVLLINPEEAETTPAQRLSLMGVKGDDIGDRFMSLHTRDARLYFNRPSHVDALIEMLDGRGWLDGAPLVILIDGLQPTLSGDIWGEGLEGWKEGVGRLREATHPVGLFARAQTTSTGARGSRSNSKEVSAEDVAGGQFAQWPDNRLTINLAGGGEARKLTVRGRLVDEFSIEYEWDSATYRLRHSEVSQLIRADIEVAKFLSGDEWRDIDRPHSGRGVADHLATRSDISLATYRRAVKGWTFDPKLDKWQSSR